METYWSPDPIVAYKFYPYSVRAKCYYGYGVPVGTLEGRQEYECGFRLRSRIQAVDRPYCPKCGKRSDTHGLYCEGKWPYITHRETFDCGCILKQSFPTCGFYAYRLDVEDNPYYDHSSKITDTWELHMVAVELSGTVVEHELGFRATHLQIIDSTVIPWWHYKTHKDSFALVDATRRQWKDKFYGQDRTTAEDH